LVQAIARPSVVDWCIEKSTEVGASFVLLVPTGGSPRWLAGSAEARVARWTRIAREAAKQSKQPGVPWVETFSCLEVVAERLASLQIRSLVLEPRAERGLHELLGEETGGGFVPAPLSPVSVGEPASQQPVPEGELPGTGLGRSGLAVWVGPEGGWTEDERERLTRFGMKTARLGRGVLRTETAGPVAIAVARLALGDW
jgi:16S rRNA (uracil1498-N3)-methyltransferase